ncbi:uncharacterized protein LOC105433220 [Pogonomyrmex barbatus]|uniref:Uncharacterized protein LOC105433220 n=1 Tax=Pogonomyrmex barbatus TaxID=144034 RepID=A0A6I9X2A2_9HYME|nr:uncharacterized protein LOC105433220 [Pogonomyrmex barbatus]
MLTYAVIFRNLMYLIIFRYVFFFCLQVTPALLLSLNDKYDAAEPRQLADIAEEVDIIIPNESRHPRYSHAPEMNFGVWRKNSWVTKSLRQKRSTARQRYVRTAMVITPRDFTDALINWRKSAEKPNNFTKILNQIDKLQYQNSSQNVSREVRELIVDDNRFLTDSEDPNKSWQSQEYITREMEDVFLQGASQALTRYVERQLHPAIKETLMLSMGYTISYG